MLGSSKFPPQEKGRKIQPIICIPPDKEKRKKPRELTKSGNLNVLSQDPIIRAPREQNKIIRRSRQKESDLTGKGNSNVLACSLMIRAPKVVDLKSPHGTTVQPIVPPRSSNPLTAATFWD